MTSSPKQRIYAVPVITVITGIVLALAGLMISESRIDFKPAKRFKTPETTGK